MFYNTVGCFPDNLDARGDCISVDNAKGRFGICLAYSGRHFDETTTADDRGRILPFSVLLSGFWISDSWFESTLSKRDGKTFTMTRPHKAYITLR
jgi:hypothetical protein